MLCPEHGMIDVVAAGNRCPQCGITALDPLDPANRDAVAAVTQLHSTRSASGWKILLGVVFVAVPLGFAALTNNEELQHLTFAAVALAVVAFAVVSSLRHREWRIPTGDPHAIRNFLTSTTMISVAICLAFVPIASTVGIDALAYARGREPWRIVTSVFTHAGALHLVGNMFALLMFGPTIDRRVGRLYTAVVLAAAAIAGDLAHAQYTDVPGVGFSGAIYGLFGATLALLPNRPQVIAIQGIAIPMPTWGWMLVFVPLYTLLAALDPSQQVAWMAHLGGFFAGLVVALPMRRVAPSPGFTALEERRTARLAALVNASVSGDVNDTFGDVGGSTAGVSNPEIRAYIVASRRRNIAITSIGAAAFLVLGLGAAALALWLDAPSFAGGRRVQVILVGLVMAVTGLAMLARLLARRRSS
jgi:membrane associated rhomboid family serine protease